MKSEAMWKVKAVILPSMHSESPTPYVNHAVFLWDLWGAKTAFASSQNKKTKKSNKIVSVRNPARAEKSPSFYQRVNIPHAVEPLARPLSQSQGDAGKPDWTRSAPSALQESQWEKEGAFGSL